jgi:hypothetical protein
MLLKILLHYNLSANRAQIATQRIAAAPVRSQNGVWERTNLKAV